MSEEYVELESVPMRRYSALEIFLAIVFIAFVIFAGIVGWYINDNTFKILERVEQGAVLNP